MNLAFAVIVFSIVFLAVALGREIARKRKLLAFFRRLNCDELRLVEEHAAESAVDPPSDRPAQVLDEAPLDAVSAGSSVKTIALSREELSDPHHPYRRLMKLVGVQKLPCSIRYEHGRFVGQFTGKRSY